MTESEKQNPQSPAQDPATGFPTEGLEVQRVESAPTVEEGVQLEQVNEASAPVENGEAAGTANVANDEIQSDADVIDTTNSEQVADTTQTSEATDPAQEATASSRPSVGVSHPEVQEVGAQNAAKAAAPAAAIIVKKIKKVSGGHHGGAWKIAYADFVTAMMAFFLLMWLLTSVNKSKLQGIAEYFKQPLKFSNKGGESLGFAEEPKIKSDPKPPPPPAPEVDKKRDELAQLEQMKKVIEAMINQNETLSKQKDQLKLDITNEGLRIQVIDEQNRPMFGTSSAELEPQMKPLLRALAQVIVKLPNKIAIIGHTDANNFSRESGTLTNWELSANRANAARRELEAAGVPASQILRVEGYASSILFDPKNPTNPRNRRVSILIMKDDVVKNAINSNS